MKAVTVATFLAVAGALGVATYDPAGPHWPLGPILSFGCALVIACFVLLAGNAVTHPWTREQAAFWTSRQPYTGGNRIVLLQLVITVAVGVMALVNLFAFARHDGGWVAAASCVTFVAVMAYPYIRHRIERGRWPD